MRADGQLMLAGGVTVRVNQQTKKAPVSLPYSRMVFDMPCGLGKMDCRTTAEVSESRAVKPNEMDWRPRKGKTKRDRDSGAASRRIENQMNRAADRGVAQIKRNK